MRSGSSDDIFGHVNGDLDEAGSDCEGHGRAVEPSQPDWYLDTQELLAIFSFT